MLFWAELVIIPMVFGYLFLRTLVFCWYAGGGWDKDGHRPIHDGPVKW